MAQGTVKWFNTQKGYGFINPDDDGNDVFVHITAVQNSGLNGLNEGQKVSYELEEQLKTLRRSIAQLNALELKRPSLFSLKEIKNYSQKAAD